MRAWSCGLKRVAPQIVAVQLDQIEGVEDFHRAVFVLTRIPSAPPISLRIGGQSEELAMTKILANVIGVGGVAIARTGGPSTGPLREVFASLALVGFGWETRRDEPGREGT